MLAGWLLAFVAIAVGAAAAGGETSSEFSIPGTESQQAFDLLDERFPEQSGTSARVVFSSSDGTPLATSGDAVSDTLAEAGELDHVIAVTDPFETGTVSADGTIAYATVRYDVEATDIGLDGVDELVETGVLAEAAGVQVEFGGEVCRDHIGAVGEPDPRERRARRLPQRTFLPRIVPEVKRVAGMRLDRERDVIERGKIREQRGDLKRARQPQRAAPIGRQPGDVLAVEDNAAAIRYDLAGQLADQRGLAGAVRTDDGVQFSGAHVERDVFRGDHATEPLGQTLDL
jgi:hypothetical protein